MIYLYKRDRRTNNIMSREEDNMIIFEKEGEDWKEKFFADMKKRQNDPTYRAELTTWEMHCGQTDKRYPKMGEETTAWFAEYEAALEAKEEEAAELARQLANKEYIFSYPDGSVYMGHMRDGKRHGRGTLRTPAFVYGDIMALRYTSDEAAENAYMAKWHEYAGMWENDKMHGHGVNVRKSGDGSEIVIFEGNWVNGAPTRVQDDDDEYSGY